MSGLEWSYAGLWDWYKESLLRVLINHSANTIVAIFLFWVVGFAIKTFVTDSTTRMWIDDIERIVLLGLLVILAVQLILILIKGVWKDLRGGWNGTQILAI